MALDELDVIINLSVFDRDLDELLLKLGELGTLAEAVDDINVDVDVHGERQLDTLLARLAAIEAMQIGGIGPDVGAVAGAGASGGGATDEMTDAAKGAARALGEAEDSSGLFNLRMSDLHNLLAKLVPLLIVFIGALPAAIAGVVALGAAAISAAAALAAIAGLGALGFAISEGGVANIGEGFQEILSEVREDFLDAFRPIAEQLAPLFEDALDGLDMLFEAIASRGDVLMALRDDARAFGGFMLDWIPDVLEAMGQMTEAFGPVFGMLADFLREMNLLEGLTIFFADALPTLAHISRLMIEMTPTIARVSLGFLELTGVILSVLDAIGRLIGLLPMSSEAFGILIAGMLTAITVMNLFSFSAITGAIGSLASLGSAIVANVIGPLAMMISGTSAATVATWALNTALATLIGIATLGVGLVAIAGIAEVVADNFFGAASGIKEATRSLRDFKSVGDSMAGPGENPYGVDAPTKTGGAGFATPRVTNNSVQVNVEGGGDNSSVREQTHNALFRLNASRRRGNTTG